MPAVTGIKEGLSPVARVEKSAQFNNLPSALRFIEEQAHLFFDEGFSSSINSHYFHTSETIYYTITVSGDVKVDS